MNIENKNNNEHVHWPILQSCREVEIHKPPLQVFTLVILEARLLKRDALRRITEYKVVTASMMYRIPTSEIGIYQHLVVLLPTDSIKLLNLR